MKRKMFLLIVLWLSLIAPLITSAYEDGFYWRNNSRLTDENWNRVITAIYWDIELTIKADEQPWKYYWWWNEPSMIFENGRRLSVEWRERDTNPTYGLEHNNDWWWWNDTFENGFSPNPTNFEERQWPCDDGYHVPSRWEWRNLILAWSNLRLKIDLDLDKDPFGLRWREAVNDLMLRSWNYWTSSPMLGLNDDYAWMLTSEWFDRDYQIENARTRGELIEVAVRCFKNEVVYPAPQTFLITFLDESGSEIVSGSVESGAIWTGTVPDLSDAKEGRNFLGRYEADDLEGEPFEIETTPITKDTILRAKFEIAQFTISFVDDGNVISEITQDYDTDIQRPANPSKNWYEFVAWDREIPEKMPAENLTITAQWKKKSGWWSWWGGWWMKKDNCPDGDFSPSYYDGECGDNGHESAETNTWNIQDSSDKSSEWQTWSQMDTFPSPQNNKEWEFFDMHKWAYENWLTIYAPWEDAKFDQSLTRQQMAKISSIFWTNFLNQKADVSEWKIMECSQYTDLHKSKWEMRWYVVQSCLLWNMWYAYDGVNLIKKFNPYNKLTVAQASVILSRMAWWTKYVISPKMWYQWHMQAVYDHGLIDDISNPQREITRWEAFMMMYRLSQMMETEKQ